MHGRADGELSSSEVVCALRASQVEARRLRWLTGVSIVVSVGCLLFGRAGGMRAVDAAAKNDGVLHVRGLVVEDAHGVERVRLGAPLPDPMGADGVRHTRQGVISGVLISDAKGTERGGYVTADASDEAFFTLDSRKGQEVLFLTNPGGGTNLDLFDRAGNEAAITVFPEGPKLEMKRAGRVVARVPEAGAGR